MEQKELHRQRGVAVHIGSLIFGLLVASLALGSAVLAHMGAGSHTPAGRHPCWRPFYMCPTTWFVTFGAGIGAVALIEGLILLSAALN